jgi:hypothetical protein
MLRVTNPAHKRLSLSGFLISKNYIYHSGRTTMHWQKQGRKILSQQIIFILQQKAGEVTELLFPAFTKLKNDSCNIY